MRQLENLIERLVIIVQDPIIDVTALPPEYTGEAVPPPAVVLEGSGTLAERMEAYEGRSSETHTAAAAPPCSGQRPGHLSGHRRPEDCQVRQRCGERRPVMSLVTLKAELRQELKLTPQLLQSMEILQMNSQELLEYLGKISEENPLVEQEDAPSLRSAYEELRQKASWIDGGVHGGTFVHEDTAVPERGALDRETESLAAFLRDQLDRLRLPKPCWPDPVPGGAGG